MITVTVVLTKPENVEKFYKPSAEFANYRKINFINTNKILSYNWSIAGNQTTTVIVFDNESLMDEYYNDPMRIQHINLSEQYNTINNISCNRDRVIS